MYLQEWIRYFWPRDLKWPSCCFVCRIIRVYQTVWPDWSSCFTDDGYWLLRWRFLPACLCSWGRVVTACVWQLLSWLLCDGIISCYYCLIHSGLARYTTLVVSSPHTCDWRLACPLLHPRDVPVRCLGASLQMTHWEEGSWYKYSHHYDNIRIPSEPRFDHDLEMDIISDSNTRPWVRRLNYYSFILTIVYKDRYAIVFVFLDPIYLMF